MRSYDSYTAEESKENIVTQRKGTSIHFCQGCERFIFEVNWGKTNNQTNNCDRVSVKVSTHCPTILWIGNLQ